MRKRRMLLSLFGITTICGLLLSVTTPVNAANIDKVRNKFRSKTWYSALNNWNGYGGTQTKYCEAYTEKGVNTSHYVRAQIGSSDSLRKYGYSNAYAFTYQSRAVGKYPTWFYFSTARTFYGI